MRDRVAQQPSTDEPRGESERSDESRLVERAPADAVEPALMQSGNPPRAFIPQDR
jgi:hypothetical protein